MMKIDVDKDILDFLKAIYFGDFSNSMKAASSRAYRDMNRTIRFNALPSSVRIELREQVTCVLDKEIKHLVGGDIKTKEQFDSWHHTTCMQIREKYRDQEVLLTFGQAQKWLNMTIKYLYVLEEYTFDDVFGFLHIPLDNYVFDVARDVLQIERPIIAWSRWDDYEKQYLTYQNKIRDKVKECEPLRWEFRYWLKAARNMEE